MRPFFARLWSRLTGRASGASVFTAEGKGDGTLHAKITRADGRVEHYLIDKRGQRRVTSWP